MDRQRKQRHHRVSKPGFENSERNPRGFNGAFAFPSSLAHTLVRTVAYVPNRALADGSRHALASKF